jgi:glycogen synthase
VVWEEPFGLVPLEAMSVGRPVIATGAGGSGEYLRDEENCLLYAPREDPAALAAAARRLASEPSLRQRLRRGGFETVERLTEAAWCEAVAEAVEAAGTAAAPGRLSARGGAPGAAAGR